MIKQISLDVTHNNKPYTLRGIYTTPDKPTNDLVVMFHGYTGHKNENGFLFKKISLLLRDLGIATIRYDFMGSGDSDGDFSEMTFFTEFDDAKAIIEDALLINNHKPIIVLGFSMGGAIASRVSLLYQEHIKKLILLSPAGNLPQIFSNACKMIEKEQNKEQLFDLGGYCVNAKILDNFLDYDMYQDLDKFNKPVLIIHGEQDQSVPIEYSYKYHQIYPINEFYTIPDSPHCYSKIPLRNQVYNILTNYLTKENQ